MSVSIGTYASRPSSHSAGDIYLTTDSFWDYLVSDGTKWRHLYSGFECEPPNDSEFSWINQGGASVSTANGGVFLRAPASASTNYRIRVKAAPAAPFELTAILLPTILGISASRISAGICFRNSSNGYLRMIQISSFTGIDVREHVSPTDDGSQNYLHVSEPNVSAPAIWLKIADDATNQIYSFSLDGQNFTTVYSASRTNFFLTAPDQIGFLANTNNASYDCGATLIHWSQPEPASTLRAFGMFGVIPSFKPTGNAFGAFG